MKNVQCTCVGVSFGATLRDDDCQIHGTSACVRGLEWSDKEWAHIGRGIARITVGGDASKGHIADAQVAREYAAACVAAPVEAEKPLEIDDEAMCSDCGERPWTNDMESGNPLCDQCLIGTQERIIERLEAEKPVPVDDPAAVGRVAMILRDCSKFATDVERAEKIVKALVAACAHPIPKDEA